MFTFVSQMGGKSVFANIVLKNQGRTCCGCLASGGPWSNLWIVFFYGGFGAPLQQWSWSSDDILDNILQKTKVILKEVAQVRGENIMIETLGDDSRCQFSSPVLCSRKKFF